MRCAAIQYMLHRFRERMRERDRSDEAHVPSISACGEAQALAAERRRVLHMFAWLVAGGEILVRCRVWCKPCGCAGVTTSRTVGE